MISDAFPYESRFVDVLGSQMHYVEEGTGDPILFLHDWGSAPGFHYAARHPERVKRIAFMEAIIETYRWSDAPPPIAWLFKRFRDPVKGHRMNGEKKFFVKRLMPMMVSRRLTPVEKAAYAAPYPDVASRKPVEQWPREMSWDSEPD